MTEDPDVRVRQTLSCSLHELAMILGFEKTREDLYPIFKRFLQDTQREVRFGVLSHFDKFLEVVKEDERHDCLTNFA